MSYKQNCLESVLTVISRHPILDDFYSGLLTYLLTSAPMWLGIIFGINFIPANGNFPSTTRPDFLMACSRFDAIHYVAIVERGYSYDPHRRSTVAFFPAYPVLGRCVVALTGWDTRLTLLVVSNLMLAGAFVVFSAYLRSRNPQDAMSNRLLILGLFGAWPAGFFFRMPYSESTFLFFSLLVLCGMTRRWPLPSLALFAGFATATRPVGLAVTAAVAWYILSDTARGPIGRRLLLAIVYSVVGSWGLFTYMIYQYDKFHTPIAFAQTQEHWSFVGPAQNDLGSKVESLLAAEPIWGVYTSDPIRNWKRHDRHDNPFFNLFFWNPILFVAALVLVLFGAAKLWLSGPEIVLSLGLLGIPYVTRAYEMSMASHARFAAIVIPAYIVLGRISNAQPEWLKWCAFGLMSIMLMAWSALFAAGHLFF